MLSKTKIQINIIYFFIGDQKRTTFLYQHQKSKMLINNIQLIYYLEKNI